jgi:hypothetical protein
MKILVWQLSKEVICLHQALDTDSSTSRAARKFIRVPGQWNWLVARTQFTTLHGQDLELLGDHLKKW